MNTSNEAEWISMVPSTAAALRWVTRAAWYSRNCSICHSTGNQPPEAGRNRYETRDRLTREQVTTLLQTGGA